jgi:arginine N-succinyltransferase
MMLVRPVEQNDLPALADLAQRAAVGAAWGHRMPATPQLLQRAVAKSLASFAEQVEQPGDQAYLFVLVTEAGIVGCATLTALAGTAGTCFVFRRDRLRQLSMDLEMRHDMQAVTMCSALSGHSHLSACYVEAGADAAFLLSRARLLFAAAAPQRFAERFAASLPGVCDDQGGSPFWDALGRHFFERDLRQTEALLDGARDHPAMVEMMPHYPVYLALLPAAAAEAVGRTHASAADVLGSLVDEGFAPHDYAGLFDGGAVLHGHRDTLRSTAAPLRRRVGGEARPGPAQSRRYLVASGAGQDFRAIIAHCWPAPGDVLLDLPLESMRALGVQSGDAVFGAAL